MISYGSRNIGWIFAVPHEEATGILIYLLAIL